MASKGSAFWAFYICLGADNKALAGDLAQHTVYWTANDVRAEATNNQLTNHKECGNGLYRILLTAAEVSDVSGGLDGTSSTSGAIIVPAMYGFESERAATELTAEQSAKLDLLGSGAITARFPTTDSGGDILLVAGDTYDTDDGNAVILTVTNYAGPSLSGSTLLFKIGLDLVTSIISTTATQVTAGTTVTITAELTAVQTALLVQKDYVYQVLATLSNGHKYTVCEGRVTVDLVPL